MITTAAHARQTVEVAFVLDITGSFVAGKRKAANSFDTAVEATLKAQIRT